MEDKLTNKTGDKLLDKPSEADTASQTSCWETRPETSPKSKVFGEKPVAFQSPPLVSTCFEPKNQTTEGDKDDIVILRRADWFL